MSNEGCDWHLLTPGLCHFSQGDPFKMFQAFFGGEPGSGGQRIKIDLGGGWGFPSGGMGDMDGFGGGQGHEEHSRGMYDMYPNVRSITPANFDEDREWVRLVEFYAPWCGHCKQLAPKWAQVAKSLKGVVKVGGVDCDQHQRLCGSQGVRGYPTIKAFVPGKSSEGIVYQGERSATAIKDWVIARIPSKVVKVDRASQLDALFEQCGGRAWGKDRASWKLCVLLFSDKTATSPLYKSLSTVYEGKISFAEIQGSNEGLGLRFGVTSFPTLLAVCNGAQETAEIFDGKLQADRIKSYLDKFVGGKKCDRAVHFDAATDLGKVSTGQLKEYLRGKGINCEGCLEKADYVDRVRQVIVGLSQ